MMFRKMRRSKKETTRTEADTILLDGEYGVMSVHGENGYPYGIPVNYIYQNNGIYIHCAHEGHKIDSIAGDSKVSFCTVSQAELVPEKFTSKYRSVIIFGKASIIEGEEKTKALLGLIEKYSPDFVDKGNEYIKAENAGTTVIRISIDHITGKSGF
jgi:nitroimidazol reductase NimA-like FMN-containing flavoprotein (pyridoxamine 5'-phosphate oxidase superfamily)